jgi:hypothetical protein
MLFTLVSATASTTFFAAALFAAKHANAGTRGYVLGIAVGLILAVLNFWTLYRVGDILAGVTKSRSEASQDRWGRAATFFLVALWLPVAAFLGDWIATTAIRLLS